MTHGETPTRRCGPTRAVRLAFAELGKGPHPVETIVAQARRWAGSELTDDEVLRVLERGRNPYTQDQSRRWRQLPGYVAAFGLEERARQ